MRRVNFRFLLFLLLGLVVLPGGVLVLWRFQDGRRADRKLQMARERLEEGREAEALSLFVQYSRRRPEDQAAHAEIARLLLKRAKAPDANRNDVARAFNALEDAVRRNPDNDDLREQLAEFQIMVGRASDAREHLAIIERRLGEAPVAETDADGTERMRRLRMIKARSFLTGGDFEQAAPLVADLVGYDLGERRFREDRQQGPVDTAAYVMLAAILQERLDSPADARTVLENLVATRSDDPQAWLALASWHRERKSFAEAGAAIAKASALAADSPDCVFAEYELALATGDLDKAEAVAHRAVELFPTDERAHLALAAILVQRGKPVEAEEAAREGIGRVSSGSDFRLLILLADTLLQQDKIAEAEQAVVRLVESYGSGSGAAGLLEARLLVAKRRWNEAKDKLEQMRPLLLGNRELIRQIDLYLGQCHAQLDEYDSQLEVNRRVLSEDPGSLAARAGAAHALLSAGRADEALAEFELIAEAIPADRLAGIPQVWYPLLQLRINRQAALPEVERDWTGVDELLALLDREGGLAPAQTAMLRAEALVRRGEADAARAVLEAVVTDDSDPQLWASLCTLALRTQGPDEARELLGRIPARLRDAPPVLAVEAQIAARRPPAEARPLLEEIEKRALGLEPVSAARILATVAPIRLAAGDREAAERLWQAATEKDPQNPVYQEAILEVAMASRDLEKGRQAADRIGGITGEGSARSKLAQAVVRILQARIELDRLAGKSGGPPPELPGDVRRLVDEARNLLVEAEADRPGWNEVQVLFADIDELRGERSAAIERLRRAVGSGSSSPAVVRRLVAMLYAAGRLEEAQAAMALLGAEGLQGFERISAEAGLRAGQFDEAVALAEQSVAADTKSHEDLLWLGQLLARCGRADRADEVLQRATELAPDEPEAWLALFTHRAATGSTATAKIPLERAASLLPEPRRQLVLAQGYEMLGRVDDAERLLREAVAGWPQDMESIGALAMFEIRKGRVRDARGLLETLLAGPDDAAGAAKKPWARRALAELDGSRGTYRQAQQAIALLGQNRSAAGDLSAEDLALEIQLLSGRREPDSWRQALSRLEDLSRRQPLTVGERLMRAQLRERLGEWGAARDELVALVASPQTPPSYVALLIEKLIEHGEFSTAGTWLRRLAKSTPGAAITVALEAKLAIAENDRKKAAEIARRLMPAEGASADDAQQLSAVGRLMEDLGFPKAADKVFSQYAAVSTAGAIARIEFLGRQGRSEEALDLLEAQWESLSLERALSLAIEVLRGQVDEAVAAKVAARIGPWIEKAGRVDPGSVVIKLIDAEKRSLLGRPAEAEGIYRDLLARADLDPSQVAIVANNLAFHLAKPATAAEAGRLIGSAIDELGPLPDLLDTRGLVRIAQGDHAAALKDLRDAVLEPTPGKYLHLAAAEWAGGSGDADAARRALATARRTGLGRTRLMSEDAEQLSMLEAALGTDERSKSAAAESNGPQAAAAQP